MGRSFESVRMGVKEVSSRWLKASRALAKDDQVYGQMVAQMAKKHSSEAFYALDDPLEAAVFSVLVEMRKELDGMKVERMNEKKMNADGISMESTNIESTNVDRMSVKSTNQRG
jgi:hypothetical protein